MFVNFKRELKSFGSPLHFDLVCFRTTFDFSCFVICTFVCNNCNVTGTPVKCTLQYRIVVQDGISMQGEEIAILNKHAESNKIIQAVFFVKKGLK